MAVTITPGSRRQGLGVASIQTLTNSTATTAQAVSAVDYITTISGGTATGTQLRNVYTMPEGPDGLMKLVYMLATGEATLNMTQATGLHAAWGTTTDSVFTAGAATGGFVLGGKADYVEAVFIDGAWTIMGLSGATFATST